MRRALTTWWFDWQQSLWFLPAVITAGSVVLALVMVRLDQELALSPGGHYTWAFGGGASGARGVLAAIAGSIITVTGTVFSITIVALQLASSQFSPRLLRTFTSDRGVQTVLGVFVGTFTYCLLVLRSVRSELEDGAAFVPAVSVTGGVALALLSIGFLIFYIHHVARSIQVATIAERVTRDTSRLVDVIWSPDDPREVTDNRTNRLILPTGTRATITADHSGYLQRIVLDGLFGLGDGDAMTIRIEPCVGDFALAGMPLASVWPPSACTDQVRDAVRGACQLGRERTLAEDVEFGLQQLADIAIKALSPGINDPTTATICIDRLGELLGRIVQREQPESFQTRPNVPIAVIVSPPSVARLLDTAFAQVRHYGAGDAIVMAHLLKILGNLATLALPVHRSIITNQASLTLAEANERLHLAADRERVEAATSWL
jgi:uncharacterized membrane protein